MIQSGILFDMETGLYQTIFDILWYALIYHIKLHFDILWYSLIYHIKTVLIQFDMVLIWISNYIKLYQTISKIRFYINVLIHFDMVLQERFLECGQFLDPCNGPGSLSPSFLPREGRSRCCERDACLARLPESACLALVSLSPSHLALSPMDDSSRGRVASLLLSQNVPESKHATRKTLVTCQCTGRLRPKTGPAPSHPTRKPLNQDRRRPCLWKVTCHTAS